MTSFVSFFLRFSLSVVIKRSYLEMKFIAWLSILALAGSGYSCGGHGDEKEWSKEELAELEAKWGHEVRDERFALFAGSC